jgi:uncharacterized protein with HEPN domain
MTDNRLSDYLARMEQATQRACDYTDGMTKEDFLADTRTQQAVIMNLMIMGEIVTKLLQDHAAFLVTHNQVPWRSMKGMRNRIAHGYFDINLDVVWDTVQTALPELLRQWPDIRKAASNVQHD